MRSRPVRRELARVLGSDDASVLDLVDHVLNKGVLLEGDLVLGLADVDLIYLRLSALLCAADRLAIGADGARRRGNRAGRRPDARPTLRRATR